jgi:hypothetical protein
MFLPALPGETTVLISDFHAAVEARRDGLHPMLRALIVQADQAATITRRADGMLQAGPSPASEAARQADASATVAIRQGRFDDR